MINLRSTLIAAGLVVAASASAASAAVIITDVGTAYPNSGDSASITTGVSQDQHPWTTPITLKDSNGVSYTVFCDDLFHNINVGGGQHLSFEVAPVKTDRNGHTLLESQSNIMGQIADLGVQALKNGDEAGAVAAQAAIWGIEYGATPSSTVTAVETDITNYLKLTDNGGGYALGFYPTDGAGYQAQIIGSSPTPEPATWALMMTAVGGVGGALRTRRRQAATTAA